MIYMDQLIQHDFFLEVRNFSNLIAGKKIFTNISLETTFLASKLHP